MGIKVVALLLALSACAGVGARPLPSPRQAATFGEPVYAQLASLGVPALREAPFVQVTTVGDELPRVMPTEPGSVVFAPEGMALTAAGFLVDARGELFTVQHGTLTVEYDRRRGASYTIVEGAFDDEIAQLVARTPGVHRGEGPRLALALLAYRLDARGETELAARALRSSTLDARAAYDEMSAIEARAALLRVVSAASNEDARHALERFLSRFGDGAHAAIIRQTLERLDLAIADEASWPLRAANASVDERAIHDLVSSPRIDALVARGCAALPTMIEHLDDARLTRLADFDDETEDGLRVPKPVGEVVRAAMLNITRGHGETAELAIEDCARQAELDDYPAMLERIRSGDLEDGMIIEVLRRHPTEAPRDLARLLLGETHSARAHALLLAIRYSNDVTWLRVVAEDHADLAIRSTALAILAENHSASASWLARRFERELRALVATTPDDQAPLDVLALLASGLLATSSAPRDRSIQRIFTAIGPRSREALVGELLTYATDRDHRPPTEMESRWVDEIAARAFADPHAATAPDCSAPIDHVAAVLAGHLHRYFRCELAAPVRVAQRLRIYNAWRAQRSQAALPVPEIPNVPPIAPVALEAARSGLLAARTLEQLERAGEAFLALGLGAQLEFFDAYASVRGSLDDHEMHVWLPFSMLVYAVVLEGDPLLEPLLRAQVGQALTATKVQELLLAMKRAVPTGAATLEIAFEPGLGVTLRVHVEDAVASEPSVTCESDRGYCSGPSRHSGRRFEDRIVANYDRIARAIRFHAMDGDVATFRVVAQW